MQDTYDINSNPLITIIESWIEHESHPQTVSSSFDYKLVIRIGNKVYDPLIFQSLYIGPKSTSTASLKFLGSNVPDTRGSIMLYTCCYDNDSGNNIGAGKEKAYAYIEDCKSYCIRGDLIGDSRPWYGKNGLWCCGDYKNNYLVVREPANREETEFQSAPTVYISQSQEDIEQEQDESDNKQQKSLEEFFIIANKCPYLGQSIIDLSCFNHLMTISERTAYYRIINQLTVNNAKISDLTFEYFTDVQNLYTVRNTLENLLSIYESACNLYDEKQNNNVSDIEKSIADISDYLKSSIYFDICKELGMSSKLELEKYTQYFENKKAQDENLLNYYLNLLAEASYSLVDYPSVASVALTNSYQEKIKILQNRIHGKYIPSIGEDYKAPGMWDLIISLIDSYQKEPLTDGVAYQYETLLENSKEINKDFHSSLGKYIYEQQYDNPDEIDSYSLFNQSMAYFSDLNRPQAEFSAEVLDIMSLENINHPKLSVGNYISVYNPSTIQMLPYAYEIEQIEKYMQMGKQYRILNKKNEIQNCEYQIENLVNQLIQKYNGDHSGESNYKEITSYSEIMDMLYQEKLYISSISRSLRNPAKVSLTVEQTSRYKDILSKLIKSI